MWLVYLSSDWLCVDGGRLVGWFVGWCVGFVDCRVVLLRVRLPVCVFDCVCVWLVRWCGACVVIGEWIMCVVLVCGVVFLGLE